MKKNLFFVIVALYIISCNSQNKKTSDDYINSGNLKSDQGNYKEALSDYDSAVMISPDNSRAYYYRGNGEVNLEDYKKAIASYDTAIMLDSDDVNIFIVYRARGEAKTTIGILKANILDNDSYKTIDSVELHASIKAVVADSFDSKFYYLSSITDYNKALDLDSSHADIYYYRGLSKGKLQDYRGAIEDFTKAIQIDPKFAQAYRDRGISKIAIGQKDAGCLDLSKAGELGMSKAYEDIKKSCN